MVRVHKFLPKYDPNDFDTFEDIFKNDRVVKLAESCIVIVKKFWFFHKLLKYLIISTNFICSYYDSLTRYLPLVLYLLLLLYEIFILGQINMSYYASFLLLFINIHRQLKSFYQFKNMTHDGALGQFFYDNTVLMKNRDIIS